MRPLEKHLSLEIDKSTLLGGFQCPYQCLVILLYVIVVKQGTKLDLRRSPNSLNVSNQLQNFFIQTFLFDENTKDVRSEEFISYIKANGTQLSSIPANLDDSDKPMELPPQRSFGNLRCDHLPPSFRLSTFLSLNTRLLLDGCGQKYQSTTKEGIGKRSVSLRKKQQSAKHQQTKAQRSKRPENRVGTINPLYVVTMNLLIDVVHVTSY